MNGKISDAAFYRQLWVRLMGDEFTAQKLADRIRVDGGVDIENLSTSDVFELIEGRFSGSWSEVAFSFSEILASYSAPGGIESGEQIVGWVFAAFVIAEAIKEDKTDWEFEFDKFINGFLVVRDKLETEESIYIFQRVFCGV